MRGIAIYDRLEQALQPLGAIKEVTWQRREIENYLCQPETLIGYAIASAQENQPGPLFVSVESDRRKTIMTDSIADTVPPFALRDPSALWWKDVKASEDFLNHVFESFYKKLNLPNLMQKNGYHVLANYVPEKMIAAEVIEKLDAIVEVASHAQTNE